MQRQPISDSQTAAFASSAFCTATAVRSAVFALSAFLFATAAYSQAPQFPRGFARPGQVGGAHDPEESAAYTAAVSEPNAGVRISAIQQFLLNYPQSSLRQAAVSQLLLAQRQGRGAESSPQMMMNRTAPTPAPAVQALPPQTTATTESTAPPRDSMLQQTPRNAQITITPDSLAIHADNSTLSQILHDISGSTGMKIDGLSRDERIFGTYGPGEPREVLTALLEGSGYNVLMVGNGNGAPRQLSLSQRPSSNTPASHAAEPMGATSDDSSDDSDQDVQQTPPPEMQQPIGQPVNGNPPPDASQPRSPQQILEELQRLRQQNQPQQ